MFGLKTLNRHAALVNRMAQVLGVDLTEAMSKGKLSGEDWCEAVVRCTGCTAPETCMAWLSERPAPEDIEGPAAEAAPHYCNNRLMLARLRDALGEENGALAAE